MKKLLIGIAATMTASLSIYAQGTVVFANTATTLVSFAPGQAETGAVPTGARFIAQLYYAQGTDPLQTPASLEVLGAPTTGFGPAAGRFNGGTRTTPATTAPGARAWFQVKVWESAFGASYEAAAGAPPRDVGGTARQAYVGESSMFNIATGAPPGPATPITTAGGLSTGFTVAVVPEPSTIALGLLGLAGLLALRRRNS